MMGDARLAVRLLGKDVGFTAIVVLILGIGIGVNVTVFTLTDAVLFHNLPFRDPGRVVFINSVDGARGSRAVGVSHPDFINFRGAVRTLSDIGAYLNGGVTISDSAGAPERGRVCYVTANAFDITGERPLLGRTFVAGEDGPAAEPAVILGYDLWQTRYGGDRNIVGHKVRIDDRFATVVGVMPREVRFPDNAELWIPLIPGEKLLRRDNRQLAVFGRLALGSSLSAAKAELSTIAKRLETEYPDTDARVGAKVVTYYDHVNGDSYAIFLALICAVLFVLLIACSNVANLLLARSANRSGEFAVRAALGGQRWMFIRQVLIESCILSSAGALLGFLIALLGVRWFDLATANIRPYWIHFSLSYAFLGYLLLITTVTALLFGTVPALQLSRTELAVLLREHNGGRSLRRRSCILTDALVVVQVTLTLVLLMGAGLMIRSFLTVYGMSAQVDADRVFRAQVNLPGERYKSADARQRFVDAIITRLGALPGAREVAITSNVPMTGGELVPVELEGTAPLPVNQRPELFRVTVSPGYFRVFAKPVLSGISFDSPEGAACRDCIIVNQRFVKRFWPGQDPVGKRVRTAGDANSSWMSVVGVVPDIRQAEPDEPDSIPVMYVPYRQNAGAALQVLIRTAGNAADLTQPALRELHDLDSAAAVSNAGPLADLYERQRWPVRVFGALFSVFAGAGLLLATVGLYGIMAHSVGQRRRELAVRLALGAAPVDIWRLMLPQGLRRLCVGLVLGLAAALAFARVLGALLVGATETDPLTVTLISLLLAAAGLLACWLPVNDAVHENPANALRSE
jgi:predicted permease